MSGDTTRLAMLTMPNSEMRDVTREDGEQGCDNNQRDYRLGGDGFDGLLLRLHLVDRIILLHSKSHDSSIAFD
jgi:hypothetical protein